MVMLHVPIQSWSVHASPSTGERAGNGSIVIPSLCAQITFGEQKYKRKIILNPRKGKEPKEVRHR